MAELRRLGAVVWDVSDLGGTLDVIVFWRGRCVPAEIKVPGHEAELTENEREALAALAAVGVRGVVATCVEEILLACGP